MSKTGLNHSEARTEEQKALMQKIERDGVCPFCKEYFPAYHPKPILKETDYWFVTTNMSPYEGTRHHFLLVYKPEHITSPDQISGEAQRELFTHISSLNKEYKITGGAFFMRYGDTSYTGSSVEHLHAHVISGVKKSEDTEGIHVKLGNKIKQ